MVHHVTLWSGLGRDRLLRRQSDVRLAALEEVTWFPPLATWLAGVFLTHFPREIKTPPPGALLRKKRQNKYPTKELQRSQTTDYAVIWLGSSTVDHPEGFP